LLPSGGRPEVSVDVGLSLFMGSEAARDDAGPGDEIPQRFFIGIDNHEAFRGTFYPTSLDHCVLCDRRINQPGHDVTSESARAPKDKVRTESKQARFQTD